MRLGLYAPVPHVTLGSEDVEESIRHALDDLPYGQSDAGFNAAKEVVVAADEAGFDICLFAERHRGPDLEAWILAAALASMTHRIKIMTAVHPGLWQPALIAKMAGSVDRISKGRSAINLVTGWNSAEAKMFGGDILLADDQRYVRAEECVSILRGLWSNLPFSFHGQFYSCDEVKLLLRPAKNIEICTASRSATGLAMVARAADWWFVDYDPQANSFEEAYANVKSTIGSMNERMERTGRKVRYAINPFVSFKDTSGKALQEAQQSLGAAAMEGGRRQMLS